MFGMCDRFGLPSLFFILTPNDEVSIRVRMYANAVDEISMKSLDCSNLEQMHLNIVFVFVIFLLVSFTSLESPKLQLMRIIL